MIGIGSAGAGSAALIGSGAFSSMTADRTASIEVVEDSRGLLALQPGSDFGEGNRETIVENEDGELSIDTDLDDGGDGINVNSKYYFGEYDWGCVSEENAAFLVTNQDSVAHDVTIEFLDSSGIWWRGCHDGEYLQGGEWQASRDNEYTWSDVAPGESVAVQFHIDATDADVGDQLGGTITVSAD